MAANLPIALRGITWDDLRGYGPMRAVSQAFAETKAGHGVTVKWDIQPLSGFESHPLPQLAERYDLINMDHPHVGEAVATGCLQPIDNLLDGYLGPSLDSYRMRDKCWGVPIDASCLVAAYHPARVDYVPQRYEEVFALVHSGLRVGASLAGVHALMALLTLLAQMGHPVSSDAQRGLPPIDAMRRAAELLRQIHRILIKPSLGWNPIELLGAVAGGECDYAVFTFAYVNFQKHGVRFKPIPSWDDAPSRGAVVGGTGLAVSANTCHPEAALAFANFVGSEDVQTGLWPQYGGQPAHRRAWEQLGSTDEFYSDLKSAIETAYVRPRFAGWNQFQSQAGDTICRWLGEPSACADDLNWQIQKLWAHHNK